MNSKLVSYFKLMTYLVLLCAFIQLGSSQPTIVDDDEVQSQIDTSFLNNYANIINDRFNGKIPVEDYYYHKKQFNPDNVQLAKRIIMLPRVGRRSVQS
ncbi:unnamed protein product [Adineta ricciae]|uniref:Uncharacterized protein n=1 Tax=Adineta ricciae TaxID=249248 RepID=A0A813QJ77_ADIRI|nr:unnamed protein product [Adineta ricciae]CAF1484362.1 unnamed protein product [Adineta ricciae]